MTATKNRVVSASNFTRFLEMVMADQSVIGFYVPERARVMNTRQEPSATFVELGFEDGRSLNHHPGQFVQVSVFGYGEAPISVCSSPTRPESFDLCVQPMGNVSRAITGLSPGDWVGIRGPYGRGCFPVDRMKKKDVLLIAGGIGMAPLRGLIQFICDNRDDFGRFMVVCGAKTPSDILFREETEQGTENPDFDFYLTVDEPDDEWEGSTGVVTQPLKEITSPESKGTETSPPKSRTGLWNRSGFLSWKPPGFSRPFFEGITTMRRPIWLRGSAASAR